MNRGSVSICLALTFLLASLSASAQATAQRADQRAEALKIISRFAKELCHIVETGGSSSQVELSGKAKAELSKVLGQLSNVGIEGVAKYQAAEYKGLLQKDLAKAVSDELNCKMLVYEDLSKRFLPATPPIEASAPDGYQPLLCHPNDFEIFTRPYGSLGWDMTVRKPVPQLSPQADVKCLVLVDWAERIRLRGEQILEQEKRTGVAARETAYGAGLVDDFEEEQRSLAQTIGRLKKYDTQVE